jgi:uncharacterized phage protein gp47/JayE
MSSPLTALTPQGLTVATLAQRLAQLISAMQALPGLGPNVNVDPNSLDGQFLGIFAESRNNLDQLAQQIWQSFNPNTAKGVALSLLVQLNGITRQAGFFSLVNLSMTGTPGRTVPAGTIVQSDDGTNNEWQTENDVTFAGDGTATVSAQCTVMGPNTAAPGVVTIPVNPIYGWDTVTNLAAASPGANEETDAELRIRRANSTSAPAQALADSIEGSIANLSGVQQCRVYENNTDAPDGNGLPAYAINVIVLGGIEASILKQIWLHKSLGAPMVGAIVGVTNDSQGNPHTIKYDVPVQTQLYIILNISILTNFPSGGDADIIANLIDWFADYRIGEEVVTTQLYTPINLTPGVSVSSLLIGIAPAPAGSANIVIAFNAIAILQAANVTINHV